MPRSKAFVRGTSPKRSLGAMFQQSLNDRVLRLHEPAIENLGGEVS